MKDRLKEWTDWDGASFELAVQLGLMEDGQESWLAHKGVFWSNNLLGTCLGVILEALVVADVLEKRTEPDVQYRFRQDFDINKPMK